MACRQTLCEQQIVMGALFGVGVGPGDPELITLKALRCIETADIITYPKLEDTPSFARTIVAEFISDTQEEFPITIPMLVDPKPAQKAYAAAAKTIAEKLEQGKIVTALCEGDPFFYGTFQFLFSHLANSYRVEIVPGVSSLMSCAASTSMPLSARNDILTILPAPLNNETLCARLDDTDAAAIIKIGRHFNRIHELIQTLGLEKHARYIERSTLPMERVLPLKSVDGHKVPYFSMILIHKRGKAWR